MRHSLAVQCNTVERMLGSPDRDAAVELLDLQGGSDHGSRSIPVSMVGIDMSFDTGSSGGRPNAMARSWY